MSDRMLAEIICRALLAIVAGIRKKYNLPDIKNVTVVLQTEVVSPDKYQQKESG
ncbi:MAG: hypothetical protein KF821_01920 [Anaerolineales bacterium]|nr:hypothetical protein [Anaerolineales bacterium]